MIVIVDYGVGNVGSLTRAFRKTGAEVKLSSSPDDIAAARGLVLPGVGAFGTAMENLERQGILPVLTRKAFHEKTPVLGICLGMQLFFAESEESPARGLGWFDGTVRRFRPKSGEKLVVPHMGWNEVEPIRGEGLFNGLGSSPHFYFCHSFYADGVDGACAAAHTQYGGRFVSAVAKDNLYGVQFHPERSHGNGQTLLRNFIQLTLCSSPELSPAFS